MGESWASQSLLKQAFRIIVMMVALMVLALKIWLAGHKKASKNQTRPQDAA